MVYAAEKCAILCRFVPFAKEPAFAVRRTAKRTARRTRLESLTYFPPAHPARSFGFGKKPTEYSVLGTEYPVGSLFVSRAAEVSEERIVGRPLLPLEQRSAVEGRLAQNLFDPQQLVVLGHAVGPRGRAGLDLAGAQRHGQVGDGRVLGLAAAMAGDGWCSRCAGPARWPRSFRSACRSGSP